MNREILFKGISEETNEWVEGDLIYGICREFDLVSIVPRRKGIDLDDWRVDSETVCQFTGTTDINGKKVFEGDYDKDGNVVVWCEKCHGWEFGQLNIPTKEMVINCHRCDGHFFFEDHIGDFEVIGNINDR
jgi:hypothetical protein